MNIDDWPEPITRCLLIDTNLLVLFVVGCVNPARIANFKRTSRYDRDAFELLVQWMGEFKQIYTVAHVLAEVSNLTDLSGKELLRARQILGR